MTRTSGLALAWDNVIWQPTTPVTAMDRRELSLVGTLYRAAVPAAIESMRFDIDPDVLARTEDARAAITRFDAELSALFDSQTLCGMCPVAGQEAFMKSWAPVEA